MPCLESCVLLQKLEKPPGRPCGLLLCPCGPAATCLSLRLPVVVLLSVRVIVRLRSLKGVQPRRSQAHASARCRGFGKCCQRVCFCAPFGRLHLVPVTPTDEGQRQESLSRSNRAVSDQHSRCARDLVAPWQPPPRLAESPLASGQGAGP